MAGKSSIDGMDLAQSVETRRTFEAFGQVFQPYSPLIIAEIGVNHEGSLSRAKDMVSAAAEAGTHAVKFQTYTAELLAAEKFSPSYWDTTMEKTTSQFELFSKFPLFDKDDYWELYEHSKDCGVGFMSTPFDLSAVENLSDLVSVFKIASADLTNIPLIDKIIGYEKPIILSTGAATFEEVISASERFSDYREQVAFLHCVLNYPTKISDANLYGISRLQQLIGGKFAVGYSDHVAPGMDGGMPALQTAFVMGAVIIEKHFTDNRQAIGNDHYHSMDAEGLRAFMEWAAETRASIGSGDVNTAGQSDARQNARRRIFAKNGLQFGSTLAAKDLIPLRSNTGIEISHWESIIGRTLSRTVKENQPLLWSDLSD